MPAVFAFLWATMASPQLGEIATTGFQSSLDGWVHVNQDGEPPGWGSLVTHEATGGNPGGYALFQDYAGDSSFLAAPSWFRGNWTALNRRAKIQYDHRILLNQGTAGPHMIRLKGPGGEAHWASAENATEPNWSTITAFLIEEDWQIVSGSWAALLANVAEFRIAIEVVGGGEITGIDNVRLEWSQLSDTSSGRFDLERTGTCLASGLYCDPRAHEQDPACGTCEPQVFESPEYSWADCAQPDAPGCSLAITTTAPNSFHVTNLDTPLGECEAHIFAEDPGFTAPRMEVRVNMSLIPYATSGYMCCEWSIGECIGCGSLIGSSPVFRWGIYADHFSPDNDGDGRRDDCEDDDRDGWPVLLDNCSNPNRSQVDSDGDGVGDHCDTYCNVGPICAVPEPAVGSGFPVAALVAFVIARRHRGPTRRALRETNLTGI